MIRTTNRLNKEHSKQVRLKVLPTLEGMLNLPRVTKFPESKREVTPYSQSASTGSEKFAQKGALKDTWPAPDWPYKKAKIQTHRFDKSRGFQTLEISHMTRIDQNKQRNKYERRNLNQPTTKRGRFSIKPRRKVNTFNSFYMCQIC